MSFKLHNRLAIALGILALSAALLVLPQFAAVQSQPAESAPAEPVPAFHAQPPTGDLPPTMDRPSWRGLRHLPEGSFLRLRTDQEGQNSHADS